MPVFLLATLCMCNAFQAVLVFSVIKYHPVEYNGQLYPVWADVFGWIMSLSSNVPIAVMAIYVFHRTAGATIYQVRHHRCYQPVGVSSHFLYKSLIPGQLFIWLKLNSRSVQLWWKKFFDGIAICRQPFYHLGVRRMYGIQKFNSVGYLPRMCMGPRSRWNPEPLPAFMCNCNSF